MADKPKRANYREWQYGQYYADSLAWINNPLYGWCKKNKKRDGSNYDIYTDGLKVYTTIEFTYAGEGYAEKAVFNHVALKLQPEFDRRKNQLRISRSTHQSHRLNKSSASSIVPCARANATKP